MARTNTDADAPRPPAPSAILGPRELRALVVIGDIMLPARGPLPAFSATGCIRYVDDLLRAMPEGDVADIRMVLRVLSYLPPRVAALALWKLGLHRALPGRPGAPLRLVEIALKGTVTSLYYSGKVGPGYQGAVPTDVIGFAPRVITDVRQDQ
jgi:hypothetical protein